MLAAQATRMRSSAGRLLQALVCSWCVASSAAQAQAPTADPPLPQAKLWTAVKAIETPPVLHWTPAQPEPFARPVDRLPALPEASGRLGQGVGTSQPSNVEAQYLLPLLIEEKRLLTEVGPEHPAVLSIRERIREVRNYIEQHPLSSAVSLPPIPPRPITERGAWQPAAPLKPFPETKAAPPSALLAPPAAKIKVEQAGRLPGGGEECDLASRQKSLVADKAPSGPSAAASAPDLPKRPPAPEPASSTTRKDQEREDYSSRFLKRLPSQSLATVALLLGALLVHLVGLALILRSFSKRAARWARAEFAALQTDRNPQPAASLAPSYTSAAAALVPSSERSSREETVPADKTAQGQDSVESRGVGSTHEEERRLKPESGSRPEEGLLRHIFEDNVRLHAQLEKLPAEGA